MKRTVFSTLAALVMLASVNTSKAQISLSVRIGTPPVWAPPAYAHTVRYYYIPEMDCYYDAARAGYYFNRGGGWRYTAYLPAEYRGYDIGRYHHVVVNYYGERPYTYFSGRRNVYVQRYAPVRSYRQVTYVDHHNYYHRGYEPRGHYDGRGRWHDNGHGHRHFD